MTLVVAIHQVHRLVEKAQRVEAAGSVFPCEEVEFSELLALGAVREPTETEVLLYGQATQGEQVKPKAPKAPKGDKPGKASVEGQGSTDPSEKPQDEALLG